MKTIAAIIMAFFSGSGMIESAHADDEAGKSKGKSDYEISADGPKHDIKPPPD